MTGDELVAAGQAALDEGRWKDARDAFSAALGRNETAEAHAGLGAAFWWLCDARASVRHREQAYIAWRTCGDDVHAGRTAIDLSISYLVNLGNEAAARGWIARAERLGAARDPNPLQGWVWLMTAYVAPDRSRAEELLRRAIRFARDSRDTDLELVALADLGLTRVVAGNVADGLRMLDESMAATLAGEHSRLDTVVYASCSMLAACSIAGDLPRAEQWCRAADEFIDKYGSPFLYARCRLHYGHVLLDKGHWEQAERELRAVVEMSEDTGPGPREAAVARLALLRCRQGRLDEAEALVARAGTTEALAVAAVRLAKGEPAVAVGLLERSLSRLDPRDAELAPTLAMLAEGHLAVGDLQAAARVATRLGEVAAAAESASRAGALAALTAGSVSAASGEFTKAAGQFEEALHEFRRLELPLEEATARADLARALAASRTELAVAEARTALREFERLGASIEADQTARFLRSLGVRGRTGPKGAGLLTRREGEVLRLVGEGLSNPEIAERLYISRKTAAHHVSSILVKLGLRNRSEAAAYAVSHRA